MAKNCQNSRFGGKSRHICANLAIFSLFTGVTSLLITFSSTYLYPYVSNTRIVTNKCTGTKFLVKIRYRVEFFNFIWVKKKYRLDKKLKNIKSVHVPNK